MVRRRIDAQHRRIRYVRDVTWIERQIERLRSFNPLAVDGLLAAALATVSLLTLFDQTVEKGMHEPNALAALTALVTTAPVAVRRRVPLLAMALGCFGILAHIVADFPEGWLPIVVLLLTYTVGASAPPHRALIGLATMVVTMVLLGLSDAPGLGALGVIGNVAVFCLAWLIGLAIRTRREALESQVREAQERANVERQRSARELAEERLRIAQELHDVVAHSMSVIAVQAGVGAHVLDQRPDQARFALEAISATSRDTLTEMRRLLGVLRDGEGERSHAPAPALTDVPQLVDDVRAAGVPVSLRVEGGSNCLNAGVELSAYRVVQEALTNVIKHAGSPTRVDVTVTYAPGSLVVEVVDDGRGASAAGPDGGPDGGHGLLGMRERVGLWGGQLSTGPVPGGGYRVYAQLPYGDGA